MKSKPLKLNVLTAVELIAKAIFGATALIVAECKESMKSPTRRIALGWITGPEDFAQLRAAAARFPETAFFGTADAAVEHKNGTSYLKNDARCKVSWSVRTIPLNLVQCFSRYEDATELPPPETKTEAVPNTVVPMPVVRQLPRPIALRVQPAKAPPIQLAPTKPVLRPLSELSINRQRAFMGNCAAQETPYITDGRTMFLKSACKFQFAQSKTVKVGTFGPASPVDSAYAKKIFDEAVKNATLDAEIKGYATGQIVGADQPLACIVTRNGAIVVVDGDKLAFIQQKTSCDAVRVSKNEAARRPVVLYKAGEPVAVVMPFYSQSAIDTFKKMMFSTNSPALRATA